MEICEIVIIGAGPAGSAAALELDCRGINYAIIDEADFPRRKPCAGILPPRVEDLLGKLPSGVYDRRIKGYFLHSVSGTEFCSRYASPGYSVDRTRFDNWLISRIAQTPRCGHFLTASRKSDCIRVRTTGGDFEGKLLIGADGANSAVRRWAHMDCGKMAVAVQTEIPMGPSEVLRRTNGFFHVFYIVKGGYGWIAPGKDRLRVGIGSVLSGASGTKPLAAFLKNSAVKKITGGKRHEGISAHRIPMSGPFKDVAGDRVLLAGDAGGFVFPGTGEGIRFAVKSGRVAAKSAAGCLRLSDARRATIRKVYEGFLADEGLLSLREVDFQDILKTPRSAEKYIQRLNALKSR